MALFSPGSPSSAFSGKLSPPWASSPHSPGSPIHTGCPFSPPRPRDARGPGAQPCRPPGDLIQSPEVKICLCTDHSLVPVLRPDSYPEGQMGRSNSTYTLLTWVPDRHLRLTWPKNELPVSTSTCSLWSFLSVQRKAPSSFQLSRPKTQEASRTSVSFSYPSLLGCSLVPYLQCVQTGLFLTSSAASSLVQVTYIAHSGCCLGLLPPHLPVCNSFSTQP